MRETLEARIAGLSEEIRHYPGPIARCDQHLPALLEERTALLAELARLDVNIPCTPDATWINDGGFHAA